jgi:kynurenine formamidase
MVRHVKHAQHGVLAWKTTTVMHTGTHMNAPIHLIQKGADLAAISPDRFFGNGAVLDVPKGNWQVITAADLQKAAPEVKEGDIVVVVTGWHKKYSDGLEYYGEAPACPRTRLSGSSARSPRWSRWTLPTSIIRLPLPWPRIATAPR